MASVNTAVLYIYANSNFAKCLHYMKVDDTLHVFMRSLYCKKSTRYIRVEYGTGRFGNFTPLHCKSLNTSTCQTAVMYIFYMLQKVKENTTLCSGSFICVANFTG
jgi:hypothetical protein